MMLQRARAMSNFFSRVRFESLTHTSTCETAGVFVCVQTLIGRVAAVTRAAYQKDHIGQYLEIGHRDILPLAVYASSVETRSYFRILVGERRHQLAARSAIPVRDSPYDILHRCLAGASVDADVATQARLEVVHRRSPCRASADRSGTAR